MACRAENPELPDATLEDGWKLEIYCKYFCLEFYLESGSKSLEIQFSIEGNGCHDKKTSTSFFQSVPIFFSLKNIFFPSQ